jgi:hypothetical protein
MELWKKLGILTLALVLLGISVIVFEVLNSQPRTKQEVRIETLADSLSLTFYAPKSDDSISNLDLKIYGHIKGSGTIIISYSDTVNYESYIISGKTVDIKYSGDWYHDYFHFKYFPDSITSGSLNIGYTF